MVSKQTETGGMFTEFVQNRRHYCVLTETILSALNSRLKCLRLLRAFKHWLTFRVKFFLKSFWTGTLRFYCFQTTLQRIGVRKEDLGARGRFGYIRKEKKGLIRKKGDDKRTQFLYEEDYESEERTAGTPTVLREFRFQIEMEERAMQREKENQAMERETIGGGEGNDSDIDNME